MYLMLRALIFCFLYLLLQSLNKTHKNFEFTLRKVFGELDLI